MHIGKWLNRAAEYFQGKLPTGDEEIGPKLAALREIKQEPEQDRDLTGFLLDRNRKVRGLAAAILAEQNRRPREPAARNVFLVSNRDWAGLADLSAQELIRDWEKRDSLSPGGFWTVYLIASLVSLGPPAAEELAGCLHEAHRPMNSRIVALWALGLRGGDEALSNLRAVYARDKNQRMQLAAVQAGRFLGRPALDFFLELLAAEDTDADVRASAARGAAAQGSPAVDGLGELVRNGHGVVREYAALALFCSGDPRGLVSLYRFREQGRDGRLRSMISRLLVDLGGDGREWSDLADKERAEALFRTKQCIRRLQLSEDEQVLIICVLAMGNRGEPQGARVLMDTAMAGLSDTLTAEAWMALSRSGQSKRTQECLLHGLNHGEAFSRFWAGLALLMAGQPILERL